MGNEAIRLFVRFKDHPLYPRGRAFTEYEAWLDLLLYSYPSGNIDLRVTELATYWGWNKGQVNRFLQRLSEYSPPLISNQDGFWTIRNHERWYGQDKEQEKWNREVAKQVVDEFNRVFGRKIEANDYRVKTISARIREGLKTSPIGIKQFTAVFEFKKKEWGEDAEMSRHLTIETLCARKHFQKYLDQAREAYRKGDKTKMEGSVTTQTNSYVTKS